MIKYEMIQKTQIVVEFYEEVSEDDCERLMDRITDRLYELITTGYPNSNPNIEWDNSNKEGDYIIYIEEFGTVKYYPSTSWYDPDEWDDPTTLQEEEYDEAMDQIYKEFSEDVCNYRVSSEWETE